VGDDDPGVDGTEGDPEGDDPGVDGTEGDDDGPEGDDPGVDGTEGNNDGPEGDDPGVDGVVGDVGLEGAVGDPGVVGGAVPHTVLLVVVQGEAVDIHEVHGTQLSVALHAEHPEDQVVPLTQAVQVRDEYKTVKGKGTPVVANAEFEQAAGSVFVMVELAVVQEYMVP